MNLENQIEAVLFFKNEPVTKKELAKIFGIKLPEVEKALRSLEESLVGRGVVLVSNNDEVVLGTHPELASLIESVQKEEYSRSLGKAGLETLAIVLYKGPVSRKEIDYIRGVNSGYILRTLLVRGLIERVELEGARGPAYQATLKLLEHLGLRNIKDLPEFESVTSSLEQVVENSENDER